jgi:hypothetical protein
VTNIDDQINELTEFINKRVANSRPTKEALDALEYVKKYVKNTIDYQISIGTLMPVETDNIF